MSQCEHFDDLNRYLDGELSPDLVPAFEEHLKACSICRESAGQIRSLSSHLRAFPHPKADPRMVDAVLGRSHERATTREPESSILVIALRRHPWLIAAAAMLLVALGMASVGVMARWGPEKRSVADLPSVVRFVSSPQFKQLTDKERAPYIQILRQQAGQIGPAQRQGLITSAERDRAVAVLMQDQVVRAVEGYYALEPGIERQRYLDHVLEQQKRVRSSAGDNSAQALPQSLDDLLESVPAEQKARVSQFLEELRRRQQLRGPLFMPPSAPM